MIKYVPFKLFEDRLFAYIYAAPIEHVLMYLGRCNLDRTEQFYHLINGIEVPLISVRVNLTKLECSRLNLILAELNKSGWMVDVIESLGKSVAITNNLKDIESSLKELFNVFKLPKLPVLFDLVPKKLEKSSRRFDLTHHYLFHVTERRSAKRILKEGLIPTDSSRTKFKHAKCTHLLRYLGHLVKLLPDGNLSTPQILNLKDPVLLRVGPISDLDLILFYDPRSSKDGLTTPNFIKSEYIELVNPSDYSDYFQSHSINLSTDKVSIKYFSTHIPGVYPCDIADKVNDKELL